jgi:uncharacterized membrane protein
MDLHNVFLHAHRGFAYLILLIVALFIVSLLAVMFGYSGKINKLLRKSTLFTMIFFHTQFLIGLAMLFFASSFMSISKSKRNGLHYEKCRFKIHVHRASFFYVGSSGFINYC